jgi:predicted transcriptional regulator
VAAEKNIQYQIFVQQKVKRSLEAAARGEILSQEEVETRMKKWLEIR